MSKTCDKCGESFTGFGTTCSKCRKLSGQSTAKGCDKCGEFFSGFGSVCEDCKKKGEPLSLDTHVSILNAKWRLERSLDISEVPSAFPMKFCLLTHKGRQYAAYYDKEKQMVVACRAVDSDKWEYKVLPSVLGWDFHNDITMIVDDEGRLHVSGNMHENPLVYLRTAIAGDISSLEAAPMTGEMFEQQVTDPHFWRDQEGRLIFTYRSGKPGTGSECSSVFNNETCSWTVATLFGMTLFCNGQGRFTVYSIGPERSDDGWFHWVWVWREGADCSKNNHLSYMRTKDFKKFENAFGDEVSLEYNDGGVVMEQGEVWVDPEHGYGSMSICAKLFFDEDLKPVVSYYKVDEEDNMQIYLARPHGTSGEWVLHQVTSWDKPVDFTGTGAMGITGISCSGLTRVEPGLLTMTYKHREHGKGIIAIDEKTLLVVDRKVHEVPEFEKTLGALQSDFAGMRIQRALDIGNAGDEGVRYMLQWESLGPNCDLPCDPALPEPSLLKLLILKATGK